MRAVVTTKGQVTIPQAIRRCLGIKPGQVLDFDETAAFVKASKALDTAKMKPVIGMFKKELAGKTTEQWITSTRGPVELAIFETIFPGSSC